MIVRIMSAATVAVILLLMNPVPTACQQEFRSEHDCCDYWEFQLTRDQSKLKLFEEYREGSTYIRCDDKSVLCGVECLLRHEGDKRRAAIGENLSETTSATNMPNPTVEVAALYLISKIFGSADTINVIILHDKNGNDNSKKAIRKAYKYYREWFAEVKRVGLPKAREMGLDPLKGQRRVLGLGWFSRPRPVLCSRNPASFVGVLENLSGVLRRSHRMLALPSFHSRLQFLTQLSV